MNPPQRCSVPLAEGVLYHGGRDCLVPYRADVSFAEVTSASRAVSLAGTSVAENSPDADGIARYPVGRHDGVFAGAVTRGEVGILVRSPDQALVEQIIASVRVVGDDEALVRPDLMQVAPVEASPGDLVELTYPRRTMRGVAFALDELVDGAWVRRYYLTAAGQPGLGPDWWSVDDAEGRGWSDIGIGGAGPDVVEIPPPATSGDYRICTANARQDFCATLTIR